ncbi:COX assembly mitochondrial protein homolog [Balaenoptera musculus]|uniref:COX assembly mitochondrial protein n=2 Tax=Balaenoptera musculus TaxID=9771 RepID=A0A8B8V831_BALMU|nr:COX assembly mitochondrial protein homolog [Balaenoptera musculus]
MHLEACGRQTNHVNAIDNIQILMCWNWIISLFEDFTKCCKDSAILMVVKCRKENSALKECLTAYHNDPAFYEECKMEYLKEREEFRKTGIPTKKRLQKLPTSR